jgi:hypothetical protein
MELSITMTKILHAVKGGLLSYCDKVYSRGNINQKHRIGGVMVSMLASSAQFRNFSAILRREQVKYQRDDNDVRFVLDQHAELDFFSASSLKQQKVEGFIVLEN